jgi:hypothetical protein
MFCEKLILIQVKTQFNQGKVRLKWDRIWQQVDFCWIRILKEVAVTSL